MQMNCLHLKKNKEANSWRVKRYTVESNGISDQIETEEEKKKPKTIP